MTLASKWIALLLTVGALSAAEPVQAKMDVSFFCKGRCCCGKWASLKPRRTAGGYPPIVGITCAGPRRIPYGTWVDVPGFGLRRVEDRAKRRYDERIDVLVGTHHEAKQLGLRPRQAITFYERNP